MGNLNKTNSVMLAWLALTTVNHDHTRDATLGELYTQVNEHIYKNADVREFHIQSTTGLTLKLSVVEFVRLRYGWGHG
jgi:hypothetical protein